MIIIAEKLNGSIPSCAKAIADRDAAYIRTLAAMQAAAGAAYIDVCAAVKENELETLRWMIDLIQNETDTPISVDSPDARTCMSAMQFCNKPGLINSVSGEGDKMDVVFPAITGTDWNVMALLCDDTGIPRTAQKRIDVFEQIMKKAKTFSIEPSKIHIDPLIEMLCTSEDGIAMVCEVMTHIKKTYPTVHLSGAVSNISFNLPARRLINQAFTVLAMNAGMDSAVLDPLNQDLMGMIFATEALLGNDEMCLDFIGAYRRGLFGQKNKP
ncbi:dihydropteroate synthase [Oscillospiraceae bacterium CM]|nr:dihydropteroate synthase [Oscillospiraceae bacterium CM]